MDIKFVKLDSKENPYFNKIINDYDGIGKRFQNFFNVSATPYAISYAHAMQDGSIKGLSGQGCHGGLRGYKNQTQFVTMLGAVTKDYQHLKKQFHQYWMDLFSDDSPWSPLYKNLTVFYTGIKDGPDYEMRAVMIDVDDTTSAQYLGNWAIATRMPYEHVTMPALFGQLRDAGVSFPDALWFISGFFLASYGTLVRRTATPGHFPFNITTSRKRLQSKDVNWTKGQLFTEGASYTPCNSIWHGNDESPYDFLLRMSKPAQETVSKRRFKDPSSPYAQQLVTFTVAQFIEAYNKEKK